MICFSINCHKYFIMKKLLFFPLILFTHCSFAQSVKPNKAGLIADFVGVLTHGGMIEGFKVLSLYCEDLKGEVVFNSGIGIKNPPNVNYGRFPDLISDIYSFDIGRGDYVLRIKAKSVYQYNDMSGKTDLVWTPIKITLISTSYTKPK